VKHAPELTEPITFRPIYQERIWGGRRLHESLRRSLPEGRPIGESWELVDRPEAQSVVDTGPLAGTPLHVLWTQHREAVFGCAAPRGPRFPLLAKLLDARETLSVQVHPPARVAAALQGEPKTEMWYVLEASPSAAIYAGFQRGVTRSAFERALETGMLEPLLHRIPVRAGDAITIPSGRCHAIGAGCLIAEIQQNSDSTYRVFDWNRPGLDGRPRQLHLKESLLSIDFEDYEPELAARGEAPLSSTEWFRVETQGVRAGSRQPLPGAGFYWVLEGALSCGHRLFERGAAFWLPASGDHWGFSEAGASLLRAGFGRMV
jgi:mannose-6-phosphate isomerase